MPDLTKHIANLSPGKRELLLQQLANVSEIDSSRAHIALQKRDTNIFPTSFAQQRLWFLEQLEPHNPTYNLGASYRLRGPLEVRALEQGLNEIVRRHEALRTTFSVVEGQPVQVIGAALRLPLTIVDLQELPEMERETEARRQAREEAQQPFNLAQGPLLRATLLRLRPEEHILRLTMHHIVSDGWSMGVLFGELANLYEAYVSGKSSALVALPIQYADFAVWQREWLQGEVLERQLDYWKQQLAGTPHALELSTDRPRSAVQSHQGATQAITLSKNLSDALKALSRQEGVTLYMVLLAAFKVLLYRYAAQDDIVVGTPIANRNRPEIEGLIGFFVNTLVLRTDLSGNPTFRELLARVREVALGAYAHQDLPFEKLVEELQPERDQSRTPLFQVMFVLQNTPRPTLEFSRLSLSPVAVDNGTAKFDLTLSMSEKGDRLRGIIEYNTNLFDGSTIQRLVGHFQTLLESIVADPQQQITSLQLLTAAERHQLLVEWNNTRIDYPNDQCVHQLFEAQVEQTPDKVAVVYREEQLTYRELNQRANQLAHYLRRFGVGPEVLTGLCVERSAEMVVGMLGILNAGGAFVPMDPSYPTERLAFMLADTQAPVLLTQQHLVDRLPKENVNIICLDTNWAQISQESQKAVVSEVKPDNQAYVIYTSGSTGRPKGVQIEHKSLLNLVYWHQTEFKVTAADRATQMASVAFDASVWELWPYLTVGASIYILDEETRLAPERLRDWLGSQGITISFLATPLAERMLMLKWPTDVALRTLLTGGDKLHRYPPKDLPFELVNNYGPTENSVVTTSGRIVPNENHDLVPPIGRPIANVQLYILDAYLQPVPVGVPGELYIGGISLARGYLNRPELTREQFIANPFTEETGARLYKTGDLVRYLLNGSIEFIGRVDHQVKIRGYRLELGEIETSLGQHPAVQESVVLARGNTSGDKHLVAYIVPDEEQTPTTSELRTFLKQRLPDYMVPSTFVVLDALPLTPNGKVDHRALPVPEQARPELKSAFVAPQDLLELRLIKIWEEVLEVQPVGVRDNFFELGGHSLLAVRLFAQIEETLDRYLPVGIIFQAPTVEQLAGMLRREGWSPPQTSLVPIRTGGPKRPLFFVPPAGNTVVGFADLMRNLGPDQPCYGLQPPTPNGRQAPFNRVEDIAAHFIKEVRTIQPEGPYLLGGQCFGGQVVFEMAQQLRTQGQETALLALFDTPYPNPTLSSKIRWHLEVLGQLESKEKLNYVLIKVKQRLAKMIGRVYLKTGRPLPSQVRDLAIEAGIRQASNSYQPQRYQGQITLFRAGGEGLGEGSQNLERGWGEVAAAGVEVHLVPGTHSEIMREPHVQVLAEQLRVCLDQAQAADVDLRNDSI